MYRDYYLKTVKDDLEIDRNRERVEDPDFAKVRKENANIFGSLLKLN